MNDTVLSQAERDALLSGDDEKDTQATVTDEGSEIKSYDPTTQRRMVRERLQALEIVNERLPVNFVWGCSTYCAAALTSPWVRSRSNPTTSTYASGLPELTSLNLVHLHPLYGTALFVFSSNLVFCAVDNLFGDDGRFPVKVEEREFTPTEQRVIKRLLKLALDAYGDAWSAICKINVEYARAEMQVKFTNITTSPNDIVVTTPLQVEIGTLIADFNICIPFAMIEPLRELLTNPPQEDSHQKNSQWHETLAKQVQHSELELIANFIDIPMRLSKLLKLQPGDVLTIDKPDRLIVHVDGIPVLTSHYGTLNGQYSLHVEQLINPILNVLSEEQPNE